MIHDANNRFSEAYFVEGMPEDIRTDVVPTDVSDEEAERIAQERIDAADRKAKSDAYMRRSRNDEGDSYGIAEIEGQTDAANASRFIDRYKKELLYVAKWGKWLAWDGQRWADDSSVGVMQRAKRYSKSLWRDVGKAAMMLEAKELAKVAAFAKATNKTRGVQDFLKLACYDERVVCQVEDLNTDPLLLNVANGTIDLTTGTLRPHNPADRITQLAPVNYDPQATCPKWLDTLQLIFDGDSQLIHFVQKLLGYSITGDTGEAILPICWGDGNNGKSTVWNAVCELLGDYAALANDSLLLGDGKQHPTDKAMLYQKRFVPISEPDRGAALKESRTKELTGDSQITARRMHEDFWSFTRTHTFWLSTNHLPKITGNDEGIWRRIKIIPFTVNIGEKTKPIKGFDKWLVDNEGPGILRWLVEGYLAYRREGLVEPDAVLEATGRHREASDPLGDFLAEHCIIESDAVATAKELFTCYRDQFGGKWSQIAFGKAMAERFEKQRPDFGPYRKQTIYLGVCLQDDFNRHSGANRNTESPQKTELPTIAHNHSGPTRGKSDSIEGNGTMMGNSGQTSSTPQDDDPGVMF